jgi:hypothetical protein
MSGLLKRFKPRGKGEQEDIDGVEPSPQHSISGSGDEKVGKATGLSSARDIEEAEANRRLAVFERAHRWDPNLDDEQLLEIDDAVNVRDPNSEARVFGEVFENSPYPEVGPFSTTLC